MNKKTIFITRTALFLAFLLVAQYLGSLIGIPVIKQLVTGSLVNAILLLSTVFCGFFGGLLIAVVSPFLAFAIGITPLPSLVIVPFIAVGNMAIVSLTGMGLKLSNEKITNRMHLMMTQIGSMVLGSFVKFGLIYFGVIVICLPIILQQKPTASHATISNALTTAFTWTQLFTALIGSAIAIILIPIMKKALSKRKEV